MNNNNIQQYLQSRKTNNEAYKFIHDSIQSSINNNIPLFIGKIGAIELHIIYQTLLIQNNIIQTYNPEICFEAIHTAGMHPPGDNTFRQYSKLFLDAIKTINIMASWNDNLIGIELSIWYNIILKNEEIKELVELTTLEPFYTTPNYWWQNLYKNKTILVITPFVNSIKTQLDKRNSVWTGKWHNFWDPSINFKFIKTLHPYAIISEHEKKTYPSNIQEILHKYHNDIENVGHFDIALIGAGCYSIPLCAYIKNIKHKTAYHLGGGLQMMFGVYGNRWINNNPFFKEYINEHWIRPLPEETPPQYKKQENGAYY